MQIPLFGLFGVFQKVFWDREMALSEHRVKLSSILNNESLIMGKQIINILPEGCVLIIFILLQRISSLVACVSDII